MRVVVITGSRDWTDRAAIEAALIGAELLIVGDCPTGADAIALEVAKAWDIIAAVHIAEWKRLGKRAGPVRNGAIVARAALERTHGMDVRCHGFPLPKSVGTLDCMAQLRAAGFEVNQS